MMSEKDLKINFRYLTGNIACMSVDSVSGNTVHNDIDNEEAIILFNSLVGENDGCRTVKTLLQENKILRENAEHNDKVVDKVNWENQLLKEVIEETIKIMDGYCLTYDYTSAEFKDLADVFTKMKQRLKEGVKYEI